MAAPYIDIIIHAAGCSASEAEEIEELMRGVIFHSTLDWQTRDELEEAARLAYAAIQEMRCNTALVRPARGRSSGRRGR